MVPATGAHAESGKEYRVIRGQELDLLVDSRWAGGGFGGYYPIRMRLTNHGRAARELTFRFMGNQADATIPMVDKTIAVEANATVRLSLSVPLIGTASVGRLQVLEGGRPLEPFAIENLAIAEPYASGPVRPAILVIADSLIDKAPDWGDFEGGALLVAARMPGFRGNGSGGFRDEDHAFLQPELLPEQWIDYTPLDIVSISLQAFQKLNPGQRSAILKWTEAGGTLIVHSVGGPPDKSKDLARALGPMAPSHEWQPDSVWHPADVAANRSLEDYGGEAMLTQLADFYSDGEGRLRSRSNVDPNTNAWKVSADTFHHRKLLLGSVYSFAANPFEGRIRDWAWWHGTLQPWQREWPTRTGLSTRHGHPESREFRIAGVVEIPVTAFLVMISVFTLLIGPVNYFVLAARKQLYLLVLTIPVFAFLTSGALFGYAMIADGLGVRSRIRSFTVLDQTRSTAVTLSRTTLYAGLVPSSGLSFRPETAVWPLVKSQHDPRSERIDWTKSQHFATGLMQSRAYTEFSALSHRAERGRVEIRPAAGPASEAANGLAWRIERLLVRDVSGRLLVASDIPAGATARLREATRIDLQKISQIVTDDLQTAAPPVSDPDEIEELPTLTFWGNRESSRSFTFRESLLEKSLGCLRRLSLPSDGSTSPEQSLPLQSWIAILRENPGLELGVQSTPEQNLHVIVSSY